MRSRNRNRSWHPAIIQSSRLKSESCTRIHSPRSSSRAVEWNRGAFLQRRPNLAALLSAQRRELEAVLCSQCTNNFCRDHLFVAVRQWDFKRYGFAQYESFSNERPHPAFTEITRPPWRLSCLPSRWRRIQILISNACLGEIRHQSKMSHAEKRPQKIRLQS